MSEVKQSSTFSSKTINHILNYSVIKYFTNLVFSISIVNSIYTGFILPTINFVNVNVLSFAPILSLLNFFDDVSNTVLVQFDKYFLEYPLSTLDSIGKTYIKPIDHKLIDLNNHYLKPIEKEGEETFYNIFYTIEKILVNLKNFTFDKSTEIQKNLIDTYNQELESTTNQQKNVLGKNLTASYNTASKTITKINDDYLTPLKNQTQDYVDQFTTQTKQRADEFINDAKSKVTPKLNELKESAPIVSASA
ncbi:hypothetical protein SBY92_004306 [Candida maltosa Xu316]|uniref:Uncharacterized protein n=1 Tax=Candida maltosa (strain Xu316) TaxID=1245528 RepID=M3HN57_CANMX|nr:hypothetical protein G210_0449 [Candida maltosa Xu316]